MKTFARSVALITVFAVATRAIGFVFRIFLSRILGAEMLGVYQIAMSFFMVFLTVVASGLPLVISKEVAKLDVKTSYTKITVAGLVISLAASCFLCAIVLLFRNLMGALFTDTRCIAILIALIPSIIACSVYTVLRSVWWGQKKFFLLGMTELLEQILRVLVFVIMLAFAFAFTDMAQIAALSYTVACFVSAAVVVVIYFKVKKLKNQMPKNADKTPGNSYYRPLIRSTVPITGVRIVGSVATLIISIIIPNRLIAAGCDSSAAIAQYGIAIGMTMPLLTIPSTVISSLATALVPELSSAMQKKDMKSVNAQIRNCLKFTLFINFLLLPAFMALGQPIGKFLYDNELAGIYLAKSAWIMIPISLSQISNAILNSMGAETRAMKHYFIGSIALFAIVWFCPSFMGANAMLVGMGACMAIAAAMNLLLINKMTNVKGNTLALILKFALVSLPSVLIGYYLYGVVKHAFSLFFSLMTAGAATVLVFFLLSVVFSLVNIHNFTFNKSKVKQV